MIREEREAARAEREAAAAEARVERETSVAERRRLIAEVYELNLQLAEKEAVGLLLYEAVLQLGLTTGCISSPCGGWEASLLQALHVRDPQRAAETATVELCQSKGETVKPKSNRLNTPPCLMVLRPSFQLGSRIFSAWPSFTACLGFLPKE